MANRRTAQPGGGLVQHRPVVRGRGPMGYAQLSMRPLYVLLFLLPLVVLYEAGSVRFLADPAHNTIETIKAHSILLGFFQDFGVAGRFLPAAALVTVLLIWHVLNEDSWRVRPGVLAGMLMESVVWTVPLLVLVALVQQLGAAAVAGAAAAGVEVGEIPRMSWQARVTISLGAGLYEELLFRMIGIAVLHMVLVDLARMPERVGMGIAVVLSAAAFAVYHDVVAPGGDIQWLRAASLLCAGSYFGVVYVVRGFGIVVAVHALYDVLVLVLLRAG